MKQGGKRVVSASGSGSGGGGSKIVVFRDEDADAGMEGNGSKIGVFRDEVGPSSEGTGIRKSKKDGTKTPARTGDEDVAPTSVPKTNAVAVAGFTPFRDEVRRVSSFLFIDYALTDAFNITYITANDAFLPCPPFPHFSFPCRFFQPFLRPRKRTRNGDEAQNQPNLFACGGDCG
jgi:hypothetical protein